MKQSVYIETSIISYLTARMSRDLLVASHQQLTRTWWDEQRKNFDLFVSEYVFSEAKAGDFSAAQLRLETMKELRILEVDSQVNDLVQKFLASRVIPKKALVDAFHIAVATVHEMEYLLTWNCAHIANATIRSHLALEATKAGYRLPVICTPEELWGGKYV